jgi:SAM-dependent methyltransferase
MDDRTTTENEQQRLWNGTAGQGWVAAQHVLDDLFRPLEDLLLETVPAGLDGALLDVGCGTGATTLAAARRGGPGLHCTGIDISAPMLDLARTRAAEGGIDADFVCADAQGHDFGDAAYRRIISRFGVMFFDDSVRAFANLRGACAGDGSMRFIAWRSPAENPFMTTAERAAAPFLPGLPKRDPGAPGQFAFAERDRVAGILAESGWSGVGIGPIDVDCTFPEAELVGYFTRLGPLAAILPQLDAGVRADLLRAVRAGFEPFVDGDMVRFTAACWLVDARA